LSRARRSDDRDALAAADIERDASERREVRAVIVKADIVECDLAARRLGQRKRDLRCGDPGLRVQDFGNAFRRAGGLAQFAPDLAELAERACGEDGIEQELA